MFLAYQLNPDKPYWEDKFAEIREETGIYKITCFKYAWEKNGLYNDFIPWKKEDGVYNLRNIKTGHYPAFKKFNKIAQSQKCQIDWVYYPGMYAEQPFKNNKNGIHGLWDDTPFIYRVFKRDLKRSFKILNKFYEPEKLYYRFSNEVSHGGDKLFGYTIKNRHGFWYDVFKSFAPEIKLKKLFSDCTFSDFVYLNEKSYYCVMRDGGRKILNQQQFDQQQADIVSILAEGGKDEYDRDNIIESHGWWPGKWDEYVEGPDSKTNKEAMAGSAWKRFGVSTDGCRNGHGPKFCIGDTYRGLNYDELYLLSKQCFTFEKKCRILEHPMECFERVQYKGKWIAKENYDLIQFDRLKAIRDAWKDCQ